MYADNSDAARAVRQAIYDGPFDMQGYEPQAVILESVPSLDAGGALLQPVAVSAGALIVDANNAIKPLQPGVRVRPSGCKDGNCVVEYTEGEIQMDQLIVTFTLKAGITWSDGTPLSANDSVYSYELNAASGSGADLSKIERTVSYAALDERTVVWTGLPGYRDPEYRTNFWTPLPRHAWEGTGPADLAAADMAARSPLGWGPYVINGWVAGERISLTRNASYFRTAEGLPYFDELNFIFTQSPAELLQSGGCDIALPSASTSARAAELQSAGMQVAHVPSGGWQHLELGIRPLAYDDGLNVFQDRADYFGDLRMRQALAMCIDRDALVAQFGSGQGSVPGGYLPPAHPLASASATAYDPAAANALLDELGWVTGADGIRINSFYPGAMQGVPLTLSLHVSDDETDIGVATVLQSSLDDCGIGVNILSAPAEQAFAPGPAGVVFGRAFDLALFAWPFTQQSACYLYLSDAIPGPDLNAYQYGWGGWNISGFQNADYDAACQATLISLPGEPGYGDAERQAQAVFAEQLPAIPLYVPYLVGAARADFCGFVVEAGSGWLQALETYGYAEWCQ